MVVCAVRCEPVFPVIWPISGSFSKKNSDPAARISKSAAAQAFLEYHDNSISGEEQGARFPVKSERAVTRTGTSETGLAE
jgi:hypothetical protein